MQKTLLGRLMDATAQHAHLVSACDEAGTARMACRRSRVGVAAEDGRRIAGVGAADGRWMRAVMRALEAAEKIQGLQQQVAAGHKSSGLRPQGVEQS